MHGPRYLYLLQGFELISLLQLANFPIEFLRYSPGDDGKKTHASISFFSQRIHQRNEKIKKNIYIDTESEN